MKKIIFISGARPNYMKISPLLNYARENSIDADIKLLHTGQHYDYSLSKIFFEQLGLPEPDYSLNIGSASHAIQTAEILKGVDSVLESIKPDLVVVVGDVNSTLAASLAAVKRSIPVAHVEAGLRSYDNSMPEEINRIVVDRISEILLVSEPSGLINLAKEGADEGKIKLVGNLMIDTLSRHLNSDMVDVPEQECFKGISDKYGVVTLHRPSNVDDPHTLSELVDKISRISKSLDVIWPVHPRTDKQLTETGLRKTINNNVNIRCLDPLGYFEFINLVNNAAFVLTDSGGIQEEASWMNTPCLTLRNSTERPFTITHGTNSLVKVEDVEEKIETIISNGSIEPDPFLHALWDGKAAERVWPYLLNGV